MELEYFKDNRLSQSRLKQILIHPMAFLGKGEYSEMPNEKTIIGNAVDAKLTMSPEEFDFYFQVAPNFDSVGGMYKVFIENLFLSRNDEEILTEEEWIFNAFSKAKDKLKNKTFTVEEFSKDFKDGKGEDYYKYLISTTEKETLTEEQFTKAMEMVDAFKMNEYTAKYFSEREGIEMIKQLEIFWEYKSIELKSKLDLVEIDHNRKTIQILDIKTTEYLSQFNFIFWKHRYDLQAVAYTLAMDWLMFHNERFKYLSDYTILPFKWLVQGTKYTGTPAVFTISNDTFTIGRVGGVNNGKIYEGFDNAIDRYKFHLTTDKWSYPMEVYINNGILEI